MNFPPIPEEGTGPEPAPKVLAAGPAKPPFGIYAGPIGRIDFPSFERGRPLRRRFQRKTWQFVGLYTDRHVVGFAIADVGYLGLAFLYVHDRATGRYREEKTTVPWAFAGGFEPGLPGAMSLRSWRIVPEGPGLRVVYEGKGLACDVLLPSVAGGLTAVAPSHGRPFNQTYKLAGIPARGTLRVDTETFSLGGEIAALDYTAGYPPRRTNWNWACLVGRAPDGRAVGVNLVGGFNDGLENAAFIGGRALPLSQAVFRYGKTPLAGPWHLFTTDGRLDVRFTPEGARQETLPLGVVVSRFVQPFGKFDGTYRHEGHVLPISGFGVVEEHVAVW